MKKSDILSIIDEVMNNREIDSIRNAILAIRDKVKDCPDEESGIVRLPLRGDNELECITPFKGGDRYVYIDTMYKIDTGIYGAIWYDRN